MLKRVLYPVCTLVLWAVAGYLALGGLPDPPERIPSGARAPRDNRASQGARAS
jgi:hypothetical protein